MVLRRLVPLNYGTVPEQNNVINNPSGAAGVYDTLNGAINFRCCTTTSDTSSAGNTYTVNWIYVGSESDNTIRFSAPGVPVLGFPETNANNKCIGCNTVSVQSGPVSHGNSHQSDRSSACVFVL